MRKTRVWGRSRMSYSAMLSFQQRRSEGWPMTGGVRCIGDYGMVAEVASFSLRGGSTHLSYLPVSAMRNGWNERMQDKARGLLGGGMRH